MDKIRGKVPLYIRVLSPIKERSPTAADTVSQLVGSRFDDDGCTENATNSRLVWRGTSNLIIEAHTLPSVAIASCFPFDPLEGKSRTTGSRARRKGRSANR